MISLPGMQYKVNKIKKISLGLPTNHKTRNATARHQTQPLIALLQKNYQSPVFAETTHVSVRHCTLINNTHKTRQYTQHKPPEAYNYRHNLNHTHTNQQFSQNKAIHRTQQHKPPEANEVQTDTTWTIKGHWPHSTVAHWLVLGWRSCCCDSCCQRDTLPALHSGHSDPQSRIAHCGCCGQSSWGSAACTAICDYRIVNQKFRNDSPSFQSF